MVGTVFLAVAYHHGSGTDRQAQQQTVTSSQAAPATSSPAVTSSPTKPGTSTSVISTPSSAPTLEAVPVPKRPNSFSVDFGVSRMSDTQCAGAAHVYGVQVASHTTMEPSEPPGTNWCDTSIWPEASAYPRSPSSGTTYVVEHACHHHQCPATFFRRNPDGSYTVHKEDLIIVTTPTGVLTYSVCGVGSSPKSVSTLVVPSCAAHVDIVVVNCDYEKGDESLDNNVVAATLVKAARR